MEGRLKKIIFVCMALVMLLVIGWNLFPDSAITELEVDPEWESDQIFTTYATEADSESHVQVNYTALGGGSLALQKPAEEGRFGGARARADDGILFLGWVDSEYHFLGSDEVYIPVDAGNGLNLYAVFCPFENAPPEEAWHDTAIAIVKGEISGRVITEEPVNGEDLAAEDQETGVPQTEEESPEQAGQQKEEPEQVSREETPGQVGQQKEEPAQESQGVPESRTQPSEMSGQQEAQPSETSDQQEPKMSEETGQQESKTSVQQPSVSPARSPDTAARTEQQSPDQQGTMNPTPTDPQMQENGKQQAAASEQQAQKSQLTDAQKPSEGEQRQTPSSTEANVGEVVDGSVDATEISADNVVSDSAAEVTKVPEIEAPAITDTDVAEAGNGHPVTEDTRCNVLCVKADTNELLSMAEDAPAVKGQVLSLKDDVADQYNLDTIGIYEYTTPQEYTVGEAPAFYSSPERVVNYNPDDLSCSITDEPKESMTVVYYVSKKVSLPKKLSGGTQGQLDRTVISGVTLDAKPYIVMLVLAGCMIVIRYYRRRGRWQQPQASERSPRKSKK